MTKATSYMPKLRAEKTTSNKDDLRVMIAGVMLCIFMLLIQKPFMWFYDFAISERPIMSAHVEIERSATSNRILIKYDADPLQHMEGEWIATIYSGKGIHLDSRRGQGNYFVRNDDPEPWSWYAFFNTEKKGYVAPKIPEQSFFICVRYSLSVSNSGFKENTQEFCSNVFNPTPHQEGNNP